MSQASALANSVSTSSVNLPSLPGTTKSKLANVLANGARAGLILIFSAMLIAALHPDLRASFRSSMLADFRTVVSTAHGDLLGDGHALTVAKVRTRDAMFIEIYQPLDDGGQKLVERIELPDKKDGYFNFNGQATNLALDDVDGDGHLEILVPSFDQNLVGHLNIYRYDQAAGAFQRTLR